MSCFKAQRMDISPYYDRYKSIPGHADVHSVDHIGVGQYAFSTAIATAITKSELIYLSPGLHVIDAAIRAIGNMPINIYYGVLTIELVQYSQGITAYETEIIRLDNLIQQREQAIKNDQVFDEEMKEFVAVAGQRHLLKVYLDKMKAHNDNNNLSIYAILIVNKGSVKTLKSSYDNLSSSTKSKTL
ncbi:unnamed protein product [Rotaria sp. Silwood2]|nr:unnamed protein product [Rotaria sp. Silwood2]CAF3376670.1 unnamed protein product [Rotaria sp. Silwood2]CAF4330823.1 unnamed protein product [Rotaria sp. Silwood2]CAF4435641.1 unnamed protein product [Rotaria sp. Silwood2]